MRRSRFHRLLAGGVLLGAALLPAAAVAVGTLDQQQTAGGSSAIIGQDSGPGGNGVTYSQAQTFQAGLSGTLDQVDLNLEGQSSNSVGLTVEIRDVVSGAPGTTVMASTLIPAATVPIGSPDFVSAPFATPAAVVAGQSYAIVAYTGGTDVYGWNVASGNPAPYPNGMFLTSNSSPPTTWNGHDEIDATFRTYVTEAILCGGLEPTITGTTGNDTLTGTSGPDVIAGLGGDDTIKGGSGDDIICGGEGHDALAGGSGHDTIHGEADNDKLTGGSGNDTLDGGDGADKLTGGSNNDTLDGGDGADKLTGGSGRDDLTGGPGSPDTCHGGSGHDTGGSGCETTKSIP